MPDPNDLNWDDVRLFLAVLRAGSLRAAAHALGVSRPTVARRLDGLEGRLKIELFGRRADGLHATPAAVALRTQAEAVEAAMRRLTRVARGAEPELRGTIRVAVPSIVAQELLMDDCAAFCRRWPHIDLEMSGSYAVESLAEQQADVAIRLMPVGVPPDPELHGRMVGNAHVAVYGRGDCWIGQWGGATDRAWIEATAWPDLPARGRLFSGELQRAACKAGMGMARLPCFFCDGHLERRSAPEPGLDIWVLVHPDLRRSPRLRLFRDMVVAAFKRQSHRLLGRPAS